MNINRLTVLRTVTTIGWITLASSAVVAQTPTRIERLRQDPAALAQLLRESGLSAEEVRRRLLRRGFDPTSLDDYLGPDAPPGGTVDEATMRAVRALAVEGLLPDGIERVPTLTGAVRRESPGEEPEGLGVYGRELFTRSTQFQPLLGGPVPPGYRIGPGDVLVLVITGDVQLAHELEVTRDGSILIPEVGQVRVAGLTMDRLEAVLRARLVQRYSRIRTGQTRFDVSVAGLGVNQIYVIGEVEQPGAYQLASVATVLNALYAAGGPTEEADFRSIRVRRGGTVVTVFDLYDYLGDGDTSSDVVLEQGDVIFVPISRLRVSVDGAVRRRARFDVKADESLADVLELAGGFRPDAETRRVAVHRFRSPTQLQPGPFRRVAVDVPLRMVSDSGGGSRVVVPDVPLEDGDSIFVDQLPPLSQTLTVRIEGAIAKPGTYPWQEGMTLRNLVSLARGPTVGASLEEAEVARLPADRSGGQLAIVRRVAMDSSYLFQRGPDGRFLGPPGARFPPAGTAPEVPLSPFDQVTVLRQPEFERQRAVTILGEVPFPGTYALRSKNERVSDLVERAGGLLETAYPEGARFRRSLDSAGLVNVELQSALSNRGTPDDLVLQPGDSLVVPEYVPTVRVEGAVTAETSVLFSEGADVEYYISNAGGYSRNADRGRVSVRFANGSADVRRKRWLFFTDDPEPGPGSTITVPFKPDVESTNLVQLLGVTAQILTSLVAITAIATR